MLREKYADVEKLVSPLVRETLTTELIPLKEDLNGGDCFHSLGLLHIELYLKTQFNDRMRARAIALYREQLALFRRGPGNYCRYPYPTPAGDFWVHDNVMSRDQATTNICAMGLYNMREELDDFYRAHKARGGRFTNSRINNTECNDGFRDVTPPQFWALLDRAKGIRSSGSLTDGDRLENLDSRALDLSLRERKVFGVTVRKARLHGDPINKTIVLLFNKLTWESRDAQLARQVYAKLPVWDYWQHYYVWGRGAWVNGDFHITDKQVRHDVFFKPYILSLGRDELV